MVSGQTMDRTDSNPPLCPHMSQRKGLPNPSAPQFYYLEVEGDFGQQQFGIDIHQVSILVTQVPL